MNSDIQSKWFHWAKNYCDGYVLINLTNWLPVHGIFVAAIWC